MLNRLLAAEHGKRIAVIENEFGEVGIDDALVARRVDMDGEELIEMNNGCVCCTVRGDLIRILTKLVSRDKQLDAVVIETTGLADPAPVIQTFFVDENLARRAKLDAVVTVVDAKHVLQHLEDKEKPEGCENEAVEQIVFADRLILNKTDLVDEIQIAKVESRIRALNPTVKITRATHCDVPIETLVRQDAFNLQMALSVDPELLGDADHQHDPTVTSVGLTIDGDMDVDALNAWFADLLREYGRDIFRMKGVVSVAKSNQKFAFQGVHMTFEGKQLDEWLPHERRCSKLVFIGRNLDRDRLAAGFKGCLRP